AREAAGAAIGSPLLGDVNLMGARGILADTTAGPDLSRGEVSEVGNTVEESAAETATVVVRPVLHPELRAELRAAGVATGLGARIEQPVKVVDNTAAPAQAARPTEGSVPNYRDPDRPTVMRSHGGAQAAAASLSRPAEDLDYLDIPAFLRRQAD